MRYLEDKIDDRFSKFKFYKYFDELNVEVVTKICFMPLIFPILINGTILKSSPA